LCISLPVFLLFIISILLHITIFHWYFITAHIVHDIKYLLLLHYQHFIDALATDITFCIYYCFIIVSITFRASHFSICFHLFITCYLLLYLLLLFISFQCHDIVFITSIYLFPFIILCIYHCIFIIVWSFVSFIYFVKYTLYDIYFLFITKHYFSVFITIFIHYIYYLIFDIAFIIVHLSLHLSLLFHCSLHYLLPFNTSIYHYILSLVFYHCFIYYISSFSYITKYHHLLFIIVSLDTAFIISTHH
jgi:hypothetical protein